MNTSTNYILIAGMDLIFSSKIKEVSKLIGSIVDFSNTSESILKKINNAKPKKIIIDLSARQFDTFLLIKSIKQSTELNDIPILGIYSHVQTDLQQKALELGCNKVIPRSIFISRLPEFLIFEKI